MTKVLVTGGTGFIGRHLVDRLKATGNEVFIHSSKNGNISDNSALDKYNGIEHVFHLAARSFVPESWQNSFDFFDVNVMGTVNVLEYCRKTNCPLTFISTYVYGEPQYLPIDELHPISAASPYHKSKIIAEDIAQYYSTVFSMKITVLRLFNVYGPGQKKEFLIPRLLEQLLDDNIKKITVLSLEPKRDYVYIEDVIDVILTSLCTSKKFAIYNVGSGKSYSVEEVILKMIKVSNIYKPYESINENRNNEIPDCIADITQIQKDLAFYPRYSLEEGIKKIFDQASIFPSK